MPELPDIVVYMDAIRTRVIGCVLERFRIQRPFVLRSVDPAIDEVEGTEVREVRRIGKRIVLGFGEGSTAMDPPDVFIVFHLMLAGRFRWLKPGAKPPGRITLAVLDFVGGPTGSAGEGGSLVLTEAGTKKRASIHVCRGEAALAAHDPGGLDVLDAGPDDFLATLRRENRTLKRALTDPRWFSGIGNAYSDEILHAARLSPITLTQKLTDEEVHRLHAATQDTLRYWIDRLRRDFGTRFPGSGEITAFRPDFAVHGRFGQPCPVCSSPVQRIRYAENETNYCPRCQTGGRILADRSLSRLLKDDWPRSIEELEA